VNNQLAVFNPWKAKISLFVQPLKTIEVKDEVSQLNATSQLREAAALKAGIEQCRKDAKEPHLQAGKLIDAHAKQLTVDLEDGISHLKSQLRSWEIGLAERREAELKKAEEERMAREEAALAAAAREVAPEEDDWSDVFGGAPDPEAEFKKAEVLAAQETAMTVIAHEHQQATKKIASQKVHGARTVWRFEVTDESLVPREFMMTNDFAIRKAVNEGTREIAGVRIYEDVIITAGRR
jgi:hypothetical protein